MLEATSRPLARSEGLVVEELGEELLVYDLETDQAHSLGPAAARVWRRCDGETRVDALGAGLGLDADTVSRALDELTASELLEATPTLTSGATRRELTVKMAKAGAAVAAAPLIVSVAAPTAAHGITPAACAKIEVTHGCGPCVSKGCCCCEPAGGDDKFCRGTLAICQGEFGADAKCASATEG